MTQRNARSEATIARGEQFGHRNTKTASSDIQKATTEHYMTPGDAYWVGVARPRKPASAPFILETRFFLISIVFILA